MKKIYMKLAASVLSILIACTMIVGATYAWLTLSTSPAVEGISVSVGGRNTIMLAADLTKTVVDAQGNEVVLHYPGEFGNSLDFSEYETYDYLEDLAGLSPVSTGDGIYWMLPAYEEETGMLKDISEFTVDRTLENGNITSTENGSYIYLDFWMVSPDSEYSIRVSTDKTTNRGSYLIEVPGVEETEDGLLQLGQTEGIMESAARIGFLVNTDTADTANMQAYAASEAYHAEYGSLLGVYQEKDKEASKEYLADFTIYEPNGTKHPSEDLNDGEYIITKPLDYNPYGNTIIEMDISDCLMVQNENTWRVLDSSTELEKIFEDAVSKKDDLTAESAADLFYESLQGQIATYVQSGEFYKSTANLYAAAVDGTVSAEALKGQTAGAVDDVMITKLKANTPQRIRMFIWLEGQDADCTNIASVSAAGLSMNIELSGADQ